MRFHRRTAALIAVVLILIGTGAVLLAANLPVLWTAGGLDAGTTGAGQSARMAVDAMGNVAIVSGPALNSQDLAVTSYTQDGTFRWRSTVTPNIGRFLGDWIAASPEGDFVAVGHNITSTGNPISITLVRYSSDGTLLWRRDIAGTFPSVGRLLVDAAGSAYLAFNSVGDGQDIRLQKYDASGILQWSQVISTGTFANDVATSAALSPNGADVVLTGNIVGGATWIVAAFNAVTGARRWLVVSPEGLTTRDVVVDASRVFVTGQSFTGAGTPALRYWLTVVAYDRATGARLWRRDLKPADAADAAGLRMALAPDGGVIATGQTNRGFLDWYTVALEPTGALRWEAVRDGGLNTDEIPAAVFTLADGTTVVTGKGGPNLPGGFIPGVTVGYGPDGTLLWQAFARMATVWGNALPNGNVCATGGYDALITCWRPVATGNQPPTAVMSATPTSGPGPLTVTFDGSASSDADGTIVAWSWAFGDGQFSVGARTAHMYLWARYLHGVAHGDRQRRSVQHDDDDDRGDRCDTAGAGRAHRCRERRQIDRVEVDERYDRADRGRDRAMHWIRLHELRSSRFGRRNRDHVHRSIVGPSDDLHLSRTRGQRSRNVVLLEHGERSDEPLARLVTRGDGLRKSLRAAKGGAAGRTRRALVLRSVRRLP